MSRILILALALCLPVLALAIAPVPAPGSSTTSILPTAATSTTLVANATACTAPGGASCTQILASTPVWGWPNITVYVKNTHASATLNDVLIEVSPDGVSWVEAIPGTFSGLTAGTLRTANYLGHYAYLRVEARASSNSSAAVWVSGYRNLQ